MEKSAVKVVVSVSLLVPPSEKWVFTETVVSFLATRGIPAVNFVSTPRLMPHSQVKLLIVLTLKLKVWFILVSSFHAGTWQL